MSSVYGASCELHSDVVIWLPPSYMSPPPSWIWPWLLASQLMVYGLTMLDSIPDASEIHIGRPVAGHGSSVATAASKMARCSASLWQPPLALEYRMYSTGDPAPIPDTESASESVFVENVCDALGDRVPSMMKRWLTLGSPAAQTLVMYPVSGPDENSDPTCDPLPSAPRLPEIEMVRSASPVFCESSTIMEFLMSIM